MNNIATTYKYYDKKGRRLAVFCRYVSPTEAEIVTFTCSKEDKFVKKFAQKEYQAFINENYRELTTKPVTVSVQIKSEQRELQTLINYCNEHYYTFAVISVDVAVLMNIKELEKILKQELYG